VVAHNSYPAIVRHVLPVGDYSQSKKEEKAEEEA